MLRVLAASLLLVAVARPAHACEDHVFSRTVHGIAADGSFVYTEGTFGGRVLETVNVADPNGKRIAWCERGETDSGDTDTWQCHGDKRFRAHRGSADRVARAWERILGPITPFEDANTAPEGVASAICARVSPVMWTGGQIDCEPTNAEPLENANSQLVFLRFQIKPFKFCGGTSTHDEMLWITKPALKARLANRGSLFSTRNQTQRALRALEALVWLDPDDADAEAALERERSKARDVN